MSNSVAELVVQKQHQDRQVLPPLLLGEPQLYFYFFLNPSLARSGGILLQADETRTLL